MSQEKAQLIAPIDSSFTVPGVTVSGVLTATSFDGTITGVADSITQGKNLNVGVITALSFAGNLTGDAGGLIGSPNTSAGVVTATSFVVDLTGNATSLTGSPNLNIGVTTASSFVGAVTGNAVGNVTGDALSASVSGVTTSNNISVGVVTSTNFLGDGSNITGVPAGAVTAQTVPDNTTYAIDVTSPAGGNYTLSGTDRNGSVSGSDPAVTVEIGDTLNFVVDASGHPFYIRVSDGGANVSTPAATNQGSQSGTVSWTPNTAGTYYYQCGNHAGMIGTITVAATTTIDLSNGNLIYFNQSASTTVSFANSENGNVYFVRVKDDNTTARTITWPTGIGWSGGSAPTLVNNPRTTDAQVFLLITRDEGVTWDGKEVMRSDLQTSEMWVWGYNDSYLGLNNMDPSLSSPIQLPGSTWNPTASRSHRGGGVVLLPKTDGTLWVWGSGLDGQQGLNKGGMPARISSPMQIPGIEGITGTFNHGPSCAAAGGEFWVWGANYEGIFGQNGAYNKGNYKWSSPVQIPGTTWRSVNGWVDNAQSRLIATKTDGTLWGWGGNNLGQLGLNNQTSYSSPTQIGTGTDWSTAGHTQYYSSHHIKTDGTLWTWGQNIDGQFGLNTQGEYRSSPTQIPGTTWSDVTGAKQNGGVLAVKTDGTLWAWGQNEAGMLGLNQANDSQISSPTQIPGTTWSGVSSKTSSTLATKTDGTAWSWGYNSSGDLGQNNKTYYSSPVQIPGTSWTNPRWLNYVGSLQKLV